MQQGRIAKEIVTHFLTRTNQKATPTIFKKNLGHAMSLLKSGYSEQDIYDVIEYYADHPPVKGFISLAWLVYSINDGILEVNKLRARKELEKAKPVIQEQPECTEENYRKFLENKSRTKRW
jgi:hypothetical protein